MIKALVTDFGRVILFPKDDEYADLLNDLHDQLISIDDQYPFFDYFRLNEELLEFYTQISQKLDVYIFTTRHVQEHPDIEERLHAIFTRVISAAQIGVDKNTPEAYVKMAESIDLKPNEILFVDDAEKKIEAAKSAGMQTVLYESVQQAMDDIFKLVDR